MQSMVHLPVCPIMQLWHVAGLLLSACRWEISIWSSDAWHGRCGAPCSMALMCSDLESWTQTCCYCYCYHIILLLCWLMFAEVTIGSRRVLLLLHFAGMLLPTLLLFSLIYAVLLMFVPIMGRTGTTSYPDLIIGCIVVFSVMVLSAWQVILNSLFVFFSKSSTLCRTVTVLWHI